MRLIPLLLLIFAPAAAAQDSPEAFDEASRAEIALAVSVAPEAEKELDFAAASASCKAPGNQHARYCGGLPAAVKEVAALPAPRRRFQEAYWTDQARLRRVFPRTTSEIQRLDPAERLGDELKDREFLLTFDDGPAAADGTEKLAGWLRGAKLNGVFFLVGDSLRAQLGGKGQQKVASWYDGMCLGWHGDRHKPHTQLPFAQPSIDTGRKMLADLGEPAAKLFRPPYGQRSPAVAQHLKKNGWTDVLWNIDTLDWSDANDPGAVESRLVALMLMRRKGIVLFHDVHPKALVALPKVVARFEKAGVSWLDCHAAFAAEPQK